MKEFDLQGNEYDCQIETLPKEVTGVIYHFSKDGLIENWREEALRHREEIKRLKEEYVMLQNASDEVEDKLQERIDKAIGYIKGYVEQFNGVHPYVDMRYFDLDKLLKILEECIVIFQEAEVAFMEGVINNGHKLFINIFTIYE